MPLRFDPICNYRSNAIPFFYFILNFAKGGLLSRIVFKGYRDVQESNLSINLSSPTTRFHHLACIFPSLYHAAINEQSEPQLPQNSVKGLGAVCKGVYLFCRLPNHSRWTNCYILSALTVKDYPPG